MGSSPLLTVGWVAGRMWFMSRPLRIEYPGAVYHVMNRGLNQNLIFLGKKDYEIFLSTLEEACRLFDVAVYAYCLMPNNYHILVRTFSGNLSRFMRHLNGVYTQRFNRENGRDGPLYRGRFKSILVQEDSYLLEVVRYIHKNPVKAKMVARLSQYKWSSHQSYLGKKGLMPGMDTNFVLKSFSGKRKASIELYRRFMVEKQEGVIEKFYAAKKQGSILGDPDFVQRIKEKYILSDPLPDIEIKDKVRIKGEGMIRQIKKEICRVFKVKEAELLIGKRGTSNIARQAALALSKELSGLKLSEIGLHFGCASYRTVGSHCLNFQEKLLSDKTLRKKYTALRATYRQ